jgi:DNA-binding IscR family transcriptional regulator
MAVLELSFRYAHNLPVQLGEIASAQNIPEKFLIQILQKLKAAQIVSSSITIADVVRAVDSTIFEKPGEAESPKNTPGKELILRTWNTLSNIIVVQLEQITFERLSNDLKNEQLTYNI